MSSPVDRSAPWLVVKGMTKYINLVDFVEQWPREQADDPNENAG